MCSSDLLLAARLELPHEQGSRKPKLLVDLVARARAHGESDDEEARRQDDSEQPDEDGDEPATKATKAHGPILPPPRILLRFAPERRSSPNSPKDQDGVCWANRT